MKVMEKKVKLVLLKNIPLSKQSTNHLPIIIHYY